MDVKIQDGDILLDSSGKEYTVSGVDLIAQQTALALTIPKASFIYDRTLGVFGGDEQVFSDEQRRTLEALLNEKFVSSDVYIKINSVSDTDSGVSVGFTVVENGFETESEVIING